MKASELIEKLQEKVEKYGNLETTHFISNGQGGLEGEIDGIELIDCRPLGGISFEIFSFQD